MNFFGTLLYFNTYDNVGKFGKGRKTSFIRFGSAIVNGFLYARFGFKQNYRFLVIINLAMAYTVVLLSKDNWNPDDTL